MKEIPLTKGYVALVDDEDYERVSAFKWCSWRSGPGRSWYAVSFVDGKNVYMHRFIMDAKKEQIIDHLNRDGLDNQKVNMRFCTYRENNINRSTRSNVSGFRGVEQLTWNSGTRYRVRVDSKHVATVRDQVTGAHIYDCITRIRHGRFARTNFPYRWPDASARVVGDVLSTKM